MLLTVYTFNSTYENFNVYLMKKCLINAHFIFNLVKIVMKNYCNTLYISMSEYAFMAPIWVFKSSVVPIPFCMTRNALVQLPSFKLQ